MLSLGVSPLNIARVTLALAAAGAWDATPLEIAVAGAKSAAFHFTYTRGGVGGAFDFQAQLSPYSVVGLVPAGGQEWPPESVINVGAVVAGADTTNLHQRDLGTYTSQGAAVESFTFGPIELDGTYERLRIPCRESGAVGTPGTLQVEVTLA